MDKIEQYRKRKRTQKELGKNEEAEIQELIDTITSKSLRKELDEANDQDLMSDLLPSSDDETVITDAISEEVIDEAQKKSELDQVDKSFYTKSMDLSDQDFEIDNEFEDIDQKKIPIVVKVILFLLLIGVVATIVYFVIQNI